MPRLSRSLALAFAATALLVQTGSMAAPAVGTRRVAAMRVSYQGAAASSLCSEAQLRSALFTSVTGPGTGFLDPPTGDAYGVPNSAAALYEESSYGAYRFEGDVFSVHVPKPYPGCQTATVRQDAVQALEDSGVDVSRYDFWVIVHPQGNDCQFQGYAGGAFVHLSSFCSRLLVGHEIGHTMPMGFQHNTDSVFDGNEANAPNRDQAGWLRADRVRVLTQTETLTLSPLSREPDTVPHLQAVKVARPGTGQFFYVAFRKAEGAFDYRFGSDGVFVHRFDPATGFSVRLEWLQAGERFADPANGFAVAVLAQTEDAATVEVEVGAVAPNPTAAPTATRTPTMSPTPAPTKQPTPTPTRRKKRGRW